MVVYMTGNLALFASPQVVTFHNLCHFGMQLGWLAGFASDA
jgi:hypothetical protein